VTEGVLVAGGGVAASASGGVSVSAGGVLGDGGV
jgi:hypothetical protein